MENKNQTIIIGLLALIVGLIIGYFFASNTMMSNQGQFSNNEMHEEMEEHMYGDELIDEDGAMMHAMDEMMLGFRGKTGEAYEEAFLRGMIVHHIGAIEMAEGLLKQTDRPELVKLANNIIEAQQGEVEMMRGWLKEWFNEN
ncbi:DUF305 domain-containing protein [Candidatus Nomurabacteria bacterium]|nr:DUF305 domain-containing protein [Candidatus Nomurabacteria bacterium]